MKQVALLALLFLLVGTCLAADPQHFDGERISELQHGVSTVEDASRLLGRSPNSAVQGGRGGKAYTWQHGMKIATLVFDANGKFARVLATSGVRLDAAGSVAPPAPSPPTGFVPRRYRFVSCISQMERAGMTSIVANAEQVALETMVAECNKRLLPEIQDPTIMASYMDLVIHYLQWKLSYSSTAMNEFMAKSRALLDSPALQE